MLHLRSLVAGIAAALMLAGLARVSAAQGGAKPFTSKEGRFTIWMPAAPKASQQPIDAPEGKLTLHLFVVDRGASAYLASYIDYPAEGVEGADPQAVLKGARDGQLEKLNAKVLAEKKLTLDGFPGSEVQFQSPMFRGRIRTYLVKNRLYQALALTGADKEPADFAKFTESFKLTKP